MAILRNKHTWMGSHFSYWVKYLFINKFKKAKNFSLKKTNFHYNVFFRRENKQVQEIYKRYG